MKNQVVTVSPSALPTRVAGMAPEGMTLAEPPLHGPHLHERSPAHPQAEPAWGEPPSARSAAAHALDRSARAAAGHLTGGLSPISLTLAWADWALHLMASPGTAARLAADAQTGAWRALSAGPEPHSPGAEAPAAGLPSRATAADPRFRDPAWSQWPFSTAARLQHAAEAWWDDALSVHGMDRYRRDRVHFFARQYLDMLSPSNWPWSNPEVWQRTLQHSGRNLTHGAWHALDDWRRLHGLEPLHDKVPLFRPGLEVATTPGQVVWHNHLIELIQYTPTTPTVQAEPVFIVPSWIMKYYILDLSPHNSLVRWLVDQGHTVFILSWRNPDEQDAALGLHDYLRLGVFDALAAVGRRTGHVPVHAMGYCLGGTLLAMAAAALARPRQHPRHADLPPLASVTLLAAETDFSEPGELGLLIDAAQVELLEDMMSERGFLTGPQMASSFQFLHSRELIWSVRMREYLLGERTAPNDLMAWNADVTRLPAAMHSEYLRKLYLHNQLAEGRFEVDGRPVSLGDIRLPMFAVATVKDHVSPWPSVYKLHRLTETELTFVLTSGGHNAGIVSEPGHAGRHYQQHTTRGQDPWCPPSDWLACAERHEGSWWPAWHDWLVARSTAGQVPARTIDPADALAPAPGHHVLVRYSD